MDGIRKTFAYFLGFSIGLCTGLSIDAIEAESSGCSHPPVKIICGFKLKDLQAAGNVLTITHGGLTLVKCKGDHGVCDTADSRLNVTIDDKQAVLTFKNKDVFYESVTWSCEVGNKTATLKLKYLHADDYAFSNHILRGISIVDVLTLFLVIIILVVLLIKIFCTNCCQTTSKKESRSCPCDLFCCKQKKEIDVKKGYTGKKYDVKTTYVIDDPNVVPDARYKDGHTRKTEAEDACKHVTDAKKEVIAEKLTEWTDARKPLVSTSDDAGV